jgi:hypothetical protein
MNHQKGWACFSNAAQGVFKKPTVPTGSFTLRRSKQPETLGLMGRSYTQPYQQSPLVKEMGISPAPLGPQMGNSPNVLSGRIQKSMRPSTRPSTCRTLRSKSAFKDAIGMDHITPCANPSPLSMSMSLPTLPTGQVPTFPLTPSDNGEQAATQWTSVPNTPLPFGQAMVPPMSALPHHLNFSNIPVIRHMFLENDLTWVNDSSLPQSAKEFAANMPHVTKS